MVSPSSLQTSEFSVTTSQQLWQHWCSNKCTNSRARELCQSAISYYAMQPEQIWMVLAFNLFYFFPLIYVYSESVLIQSNSTSTRLLWKVTESKRNERFSTNDVGPWEEWVTTERQAVYVCVCVCVCVRGRRVWSGLRVVTSTSSCSR